MKQYRYRALVKLEPSGRSAGAGPTLPETGGRVVVRARHHDTHRSKIFSALVTTVPGEAVRAAVADADPASGPAVGHLGGWDGLTAGRVMPDDPATGAVVPSRARCRGCVHRGAV